MGGAITTDRCTISLLLYWLVIGVLLPLVAMTTTGPICQRDGCNCTTTANYWIRANCTFKAHQTIEIEANSLPTQLIELEVNTCKELSFSEGAFSRLQAMQFVRVRHVGHLRVRKHTFLRLASRHAQLEVTDCDAAVFETHAFRAVQGPLTVVVARCGHVIIQGTAFSWLLSITVRDIARLELAEKSFSFEKPPASFESSRREGYSHGPATKVLLQNVILADIPQFAFPTSAAELRLVNVEARVIRRDAFSAIQLSAVIIQNSSLHRIENGAFSERTLIEKLELTTNRVRYMETNAILGAIQNLTIQHSRFVEVVGGAINVTLASVKISNNVFEKIHAHGFIFKKWNRLILDSNIFQWTDVDAFNIKFNTDATVNVFAFMNNELETFQAGAFSFVAEALQVGEKLDARVYGNRFAKSCSCKLTGWLEDNLGGSQDTVQWLFNTSFCTVGSGLLAQCFNVTQGFVSMSNFTDIVCGATSVLVCDDARQSDIVTSVLRDINNQVPTAINTTYDSEMDNKKKVLGLIALVVVIAVATILMVTMLLWMKRKGYCVQVKIMLLPSTTSCVTMFHRMCGSFRGGGNGIVAAGSISRLPVHEYTEIQQQQQQQQQQQMRMTTLVVEEESDGEVENEYIPCAEKWTQTLPEELTQELLQSLRDKLDDPENYSEARDMIEHLYDLIKVEESCSNNNTPSTSDTIEAYDDDYEDGNLYDVIQPPISTPARRLKQCNGRAKRDTCSVGTRAPSPDKLLPATTYAQIKRSRRPDVVREYAQPRDHQPHLYTELPGGASGPPRSAPPVVTPPALSPGRGPSRPLSFLRALGESILTAATTPGASNGRVASNGASLVCEYAEPTDVRVHEYSELPISVKCPNKMANRPLPNKPGELDPGEGPSSST